VLPKGDITFGSFNSTTKLNTEVFDVRSASAGSMAMRRMARFGKGIGKGGKGIRPLYYFTKM
jgi:hypothetical protein